jgi:hypothetical protein
LVSASDVFRTGEQGLSDAWSLGTHATITAIEK